MPPLLMFCLALAIRLLFFAIFFKAHPLQCAFDSKHYHELAVNVVNQGAFVHNDGRAQFYRMPGYSLFLAFFYKLFGPIPDYAVLAQIILSSLLPLLIIAVASTLFGTSKQTNLIIGILAALHPGFIIFSNLLMTETLFCLLFLLFSILGIPAKKTTPTMLVLGGALLGFATITRPLGMHYFVISLLVFAVTFGIKKNCWYYLALIGGWLSTFAWWPLRNFLLTGMLFLHTLPGPHLLNHGAIPILMHTKKLPHQEAQQLVYTQVQKACPSTMSEPQRSACMEQISISIIASYPLSTLIHFAKHMLKTTLGLFSAEFLWMDAGGSLPPYDANRSWRDALYRFLYPAVSRPWMRWFIYAEIFYNALLLLCSLGGLYLCLRKGLMWQSIWVILLIGCTIFLSGFCGYARLRLPTEPFFIMFAGMFLGSILQKKGVDAWKAKTKKRLSL